MDLKDEFGESFIILASDVGSASRFLLDNGLHKRILNMGPFIKRLSLISKDSMIYLMGELKGASHVKHFIDILMLFGERFSETL